MNRDRTLLEVFEQRYLPIRLLGCSDHCKAQYRWNIAHYGDYLGRSATLADLRDTRISAFLESLLTKGKAIATVNTVRKQLVSLWRFCAERRLTKRFPQVRRMVEPDRVPEAFTVEQLGTLIYACSQEKGEYAGIPASKWLLGIHYVWWDTAERRGATLQIRRADVDLGRATILVRAEHRKGKKRDRLYRVESDTVERLRDIWLPERELLFPYPFHFTTFYNRYKRMLKFYGLPTGRRWGPHAIRRSHASYLKKMGGDPQASLDHANPATTLLYLDPSIVDAAPPSSLLPRLVMSPPIDPPPQAA
jgi:integrase